MALAYIFFVSLLLIKKELYLIKRKKEGSGVNFLSLIVFINNYIYNMTVKLKNNRGAFLKSLPTKHIKYPLLKSILVLIIGLPLSFILLGFSGFFIDQIKIQNINSFLGIVIQNSPFLLLCLIFFYKKDYKKLLVKIISKNKNKSTLITILFFAILFIVSFLIVFILEISNSSSGASNNLDKYFNSTLSFEYVMNSLLGLLMFVVLAAFEELVFRFTIFRHLRKKGLIYSLIISSLLFSLLHANIGIPFSFVAGIVFALHYEYTNNIISTILLHGLHNYLNIYYAGYFAYQLLK